MASCGEGTDDVVEDSVDSDGTASPLRTNRDGLVMGMNRLASQSCAGIKKGAEHTERNKLLRTEEEQMFSSSTGLRKGAGDIDNSRLLCTGEEQMFSSSDEDDSEQSQLLLPQSLQISPHLQQLKHPGENTPVFPSHLSHMQPKGEHSPVLSHLNNLKHPPENSPVFPPPAKIRKLSGETVTKEKSAENVDNDSDVTQLSDNIEPQPEPDLRNNSHDLAGEEQDGGKGIQSCRGDQSSRCSWEGQQTKCEGDERAAAVQDSADRGTAAIEVMLSQEGKMHREEQLRKEESSEEDGAERGENCLERGKEIPRIQDVLEGVGQGEDETERSKTLLGKRKQVTRGQDVSGESGEVSKGTGSEKGSSSLGSLQESVVAVSDVGADKTLCEQHDEEMRLLGRLEARQEKLNPLLSTMDRATGLKVSRELSCIQSLIATLIQAHQRQRRAISALSTEQMQEQMRLFVQRHKRLVQIFSVQKTATARFKGRMKVTASQSNSKVTSVGEDDANQSQPMSQTLSDISNEREKLIGRKSVGCKKGRKSAASSSKSGSSKSSNVKSQGSSEKQVISSSHDAAAQKLPLSTSSATAEVPLTDSSKESATAVQVLQALDGSSHLRAVMKAGSLQKGQIVQVVSQSGKEPVRYRVVGMENVGTEGPVQTSVSSNNRVAANSGQTIQHASENVAKSPATVVSTVGHTIATTVSARSSTLLSQHGSENVAKSADTVVSTVGHTIATTVSAGSSTLLAQQVATTDCSQTLLKTQAWKPPFKPSDGVSSETQGISEVTETNVRTTQVEMVNSAKGAVGAQVPKQSRADFLWQKIVPQFQKQSVTFAETVPSAALKECLVGTKGLSTSGGVGGQLQGLSTTGWEGGQLQGLSTTGGEGGQPKGLSTVGIAGGQHIQGLSTTGGAGQLKGKSTTGGASGLIQGPSTIVGAGGQPKGLSIMGATGQQLKGLSTTGGVGAQPQSVTCMSERQPQGLSTNIMAGGQHTQGLSTTVMAGGHHTQGLSTTIMAGAKHTQGLSTTVMAGGHHTQGLSTTVMAGAQHTQGPSTTVMAGAQHSQGLSTTVMAGAQHTQGLSTTAVMEGQTPGTEVPTVPEMLRAQLVQPGKDVLSCKGKAGLQFASLQPDGAVMTQGGLSFSTVGQWHRAIWGHRTGQKRAMVFRQVCYKGTPLADVSSKFTPAPAHLKHMQGTGGTPVGQVAIPVQSTVQVQPIQGTGVTPSGKTITPGPAHLKHMQGTGGTPVGQAAIPVQSTVQVQPIQGTGVTPSGKTITPGPAHLKHMQGGTPVGQATIPLQPIQVTGVTPAEQTVTPVQVQNTHSSLQEDVEVMEEQQISLPCSGCSSPRSKVLQDIAQDNGTRPHNMAQDAVQDDSIPKPTSILLIANEELFLSRRLLPEKFWDSTEVKLNQFLEAAVRFE